MTNAISPTREKNSPDTSAVVPVVLPNGSKIRIEARALDGAGMREKVGITDLAFTELIRQSRNLQAVLARRHQGQPQESQR